MKKALQELQDVIDRLTAPDGCPWDQKQTPESMADYFIEESHELVTAIRSGNERDICEELGDVAFLLVFVARLYEKTGKFSLADALNSSREKMIRRHPHVFGDTVFADQAEQLKAWEAIKKSEHKEDGDGGKSGVFASLPTSLPPLLKAYRIHSKAARAGFTWDDDTDVEQQVEAEWLELLDALASADTKAQKHELGDMLFSLVELGRRKEIKASEALDLACQRFLRRFASMEKLASEAGQDFVSLSLDDKDELWNKAKAGEKAGVSGS